MLELTGILHAYRRMEVNSVRESMPDLESEVGEK